MKIDLIVDKTKLIKEDNCKIFSTEADYFPAYIELKNAIKNNADKKIILYSVSTQQKLLNSLKKYRNIEINALIIDYKNLLKTKWNIDFDFEMSNDDIKQSNLLEFEIKSPARIPISSFILKNFITNYLDNLNICLNNYALLINELIEFDLKINEYPELFSRILQFRLNSLRKSSQNNDENNLIGLIFDIKKVYEYLCLYKLIYNYPHSFQNKVLNSDLLTLFKVKRINVDKLKLNEFIKSYSSYKTIFINELNIFINKYLSDKEKIGRDAIIELIKYFSGEIQEEAEIIIPLLKTNYYLIDSEIITLLLTKFSSLKDIYYKKIYELKDYIPPKKPTPFNDKSNFEENIEWAVNEYLPYKYWIENSRIIDNDILEQGVKFSDFYYENYSEKSYNYNNFLYRYIYNFKDDIKSTEYSIILVLDNFNFKFYDSLKESFSKYKIFESKIVPYACMLPTITRIGKSAIISGKRDKADIDSSNYENSFNSTYKSFFKDYKVSYFSKLGKLDSYEIKEKEIIIINYLEIDEQLHKPYQRTAIETKVMINFLIENLTEKINSLIKRNRIETKTKIFFISDHGSTYILPEMESKIDVEYFKRKNLDTSHRCISVDDKTFNDLKSNNDINENIQFLDKQSSGDSNNYIIAKGYNRFLQINEDYYIHGGTLPEEVIVPAGYFAYMEEEIKPIIIQLTKTDFRLLTKEELKLRVANPNNNIIKNCLINILNEGIQSEDYILENIDSLTERTININMRIKDKTIKILIINVTYFINNKIYKEEFNYKINIKKAIEDSLNLEDLL